MSTMPPPQGPDDELPDAEGQPGQPGQHYAQPVFSQGAPSRRYTTTTMLWVIGVLILVLVGGCAVVLSLTAG